MKQMPKYLQVVAIASVLVALAPGCMTPAEVRAQDGLTAFKRCDLRGASKAFEDAHSLDASRADFALAYALSTLAILPEDPAVTAVLTRLGFTGPIDTSLFWGAGGVFDQLTARGATCQSVSDYVTQRFPYPAVQKNGPTAASLVRDTHLTGNDFVVAAAALDPRLQKLVQALEQAAMGAGETDIEGGCGVGKVHVQAPELYGLASFIEFVRAATQTAQAYDWGVAAALALDNGRDQRAYADALNAHVLHVMDAAAAKNALPTALHAIKLAKSGLARAATLTSRPANSLFDWSSMPAGTLADLQTLVDSADQMLSAPGPQGLPFYSPALLMDLRSFFDSPVDASGVQPPIWSATLWTDPSGQTGYSLSSTSHALDPLISSRFSPSPFAMGAPKFTFTLQNKWKAISSNAWKAAFDPDKRWDNLYGCSN